jgi:hypothetical protein
MNIAMDYSWYAKIQSGSRIMANGSKTSFCRGIDTFEDQFNVDGTLPTLYFCRGFQLRHSLGLVSTSAAASIMGRRQKLEICGCCLECNWNRMLMDILILLRWFCYTFQCNAFKWELPDYQT